MAIVLVHLLWFIAASLALALCRSQNIKMGVAVAAAGAGGWSSLLCLSLTLAVFNLYSIDSFLSAVSFALCIVILAGVVAFTWAARRRSQLPLLQALMSSFSWFFPVCCLFIFIYLSLHSLNPADGWDVLDFWAPIAASYVDHVVAADLPFAMVNCRSPGFDCTVFSESFYRHPPTLTYLLGFFSWAAYETSWTNWIGLWGLITLSITLVVWGWCFYASENAYIAAFAALLLVFGMPLVENHFFLPGYSAIPLATSYLLALVFMAFGFARDRMDWRFFLVGVGFAVSCAFFRNTGVILSLVSLACAAFTLLLNKKILLAAIIAVSLIAAVTFGVYGFDIKAFDMHFAYKPEGRILYFGGKVLSFESDFSASVVASEVRGKFLNSSFSMAALFVLLVIPSFYRSREFLFLWVSFSVFYLALFLIQFSDYGSAISMPGSDTGISRMSIPAYMQVVLLLPLVLRVAEGGRGARQRT